MQGHIFQRRCSTKKCKNKIKGKLIASFKQLSLPPGKEKEFADILDQNLDFVADDSVLSGETHSWKVEGENAPAFLPPTLGVPTRAAGASAARGGALPALPVGPSIGGGQAAAASSAWPPPPPVPRVYADAHGVYGHRAAANSGGSPVAAYTAGSPFPFSAVGAGQSRICGGPAAAAAERCRSALPQLPGRAAVLPPRTLPPSPSAPPAVESAKLRQLRRRVLAVLRLVHGTPSRP